MTDTATADRPTVELIVNTLHRVFPSFLLTGSIVDIWLTIYLFRYLFMYLILRLLFGDPAY